MCGWCTQEETQVVGAPGVQSWMESTRKWVHLCLPPLWAPGGIVGRKRSLVLECQESGGLGSLASAPGSSECSGALAVSLLPVGGRGALADASCLSSPELGDSTPTSSRQHCPEADRVVGCHPGHPGCEIQKICQTYGLRPSSTNPYTPSPPQDIINTKWDT